MNSIILSLAAKYVKPILLLFSIFILLRGHNAPGGGFIAGLLAGSGFIFYAMAEGINKGYQSLPLKPEQSIKLGFTLIFLSAIGGLITAEAVMKGMWIKIDLAITVIKIGTPLIFDAGIYFVVTGVLIMITFTIMNEIQWK